MNPTKEIYYLFDYIVVSKINYHKHNIGEREKLKKNVGYTDELAYAFCI